MGTRKKGESYEDFRERINAKAREKWKEITEEQREGKRASERKYRAKRYTEMPVRFAKLVQTAKYRTKDKEFEFNIDRDYLLEILEEQGGACAVTGTEFDISVTGVTNYDGPSLDRIDPTKGYVKGNVRIVVWWYNIWKHTMSDEEVLEKARLLVELNN